jgi:hypothetical protein
LLRHRDDHASAVRIFEDVVSGSERKSDASVFDRQPDSDRTRGLAAVGRI